MATWSVKTADKKSVEEHELWEKNGMVIRRITGFRWGEFNVTTDDDNPPDLDQSDGPGANAVDMWSCGYESELVSLDDGWYADIIWPDDLPTFARDTLEVAWEEDAYCSWEEDGWIQTDTEVWFMGPLEIEKIEE